jgi:hypothetical protein
MEEEERKKFIKLKREEYRLLKENSRFSLPWGQRLPIAASLSFVAGMALGLSHGSQTTGLRFRAENAHRLPTTPTGWYLYHKSKNYNMALGGVKEGFKMGGKVSFWTAAFFSVEEIFDRYRGTKDFINTVIASLSVAGGFSLWSMSLPSTLQQTLIDPYRPLSNNHCSENGQEWVGHRLGVRACSGCNRSRKGKETGLCRLHLARRTTKSAHREERNGMINMMGTSQPAGNLPTTCYPTRVVWCRLLH